MTKLKWRILKDFLYYAQEAMPLKIQEVHILNMAPFMTVFLNLMKSWLNQDLMSRVRYTIYVKILKYELPNCLTDLEVVP